MFTVQGLVFGVQRLVFIGRDLGLRNFIEKSLNLELSGNQVYYSNAKILLIKIMLCSKLIARVF